MGTAKKFVGNEQFLGAILASLLLFVIFAGCKERSIETVDAAAIKDVSLRDVAVDQNQRDGEGEGGCIQPPEGGVDEGQPSDSISDGDSQRPDMSHEDTGPSSCPPCMVLVNNTFCIDRYEASRPDATASFQGTQTGAAQCTAGVIPWTAWPLTQGDAATACVLAGKRLCSAVEWQQACSGPQQTIYGYGNLYDPTICNGIDTYCLCGAGQPCDGVTPCPYPHCFNQPPPGGTPALGCGAMFHVTPTGAHPGCVNGWGLFDMNGNVWEVIASSDGLDHFRGGAYNCGDSETLHRCDYDATWGPTAQGFRCCADPTP